MNVVKPFDLSSISIHYPPLYSFDIHILLFNHCHADLHIFFFWSQHKKVQYMWTLQALNFIILIFTLFSFFFATPVQGSLFVTLTHFPHVFLSFFSATLTHYINKSNSTAAKLPQKPAVSTSPRIYSLTHEQVIYGIFLFFFWHA